MGRLTTHNPTALAAIDIPRLFIHEKSTVVSDLAIQVRINESGGFDDNAEINSIIIEGLNIGLLEGKEIKI